MARAQPKQTAEDVRRNIVNNLSWRAATRDDRHVAQAIHQGQELDAIYGLNEVGWLDEFWHFLDLVGFNAHHVRNGFTKRGDHARKKKPKQGPLSPQCLAQQLSQLPIAGVMVFVNGCLRGVAALGLCAAEVTAVVDGSPLQTTENYEGHGTLRKDRRKRQKGGSWVTVIDDVFGWKVVALMDLATRISLAVKVITIEAYEGEWLVPLLQQAQANLGAHARIGHVVADRGYLDGVDLWEVHQAGIIFVILAKAGMHVRDAAVAQAARGTVQRRSRIVRHGHGRFQTTETVTTELVAVSALNEYVQFGPPPAPGKRRSRAKPPPLERRGGTQVEQS